MMKSYIIPILLWGTSLCSRDLVISNQADLIDFSSSVNKGLTYDGLTVVLDADITISGQDQINPIGNSSTNIFSGTFDGQGHVVNGFSVNSSTLNYMGLFGHVNGATIRNVIVDGSYLSSASELTVGGIVGLCEDCIVENCVNQVAIKHTGSGTSYYPSYPSSYTDYYSKTLYMGGIVGQLSSLSSDPTVINCANYGEIYQSMFSWTAYIGGVVGCCTGTSACNIQNSVNYGKTTGQLYTITYTGMWSISTFSGGIVGYTNSSCTIENCLSAGELVSAGQVSFGAVKAKPGVIIGNTSTTESTVTIENSFWTKGVNVAINTTIAGASLAEENSTTVTLLNERASAKSWNKWLFTQNSNAGIAFHINGGEVGFTCASPIVLLPDPTGGSEHTFSGWFTDKPCTQSFTVDDSGTSVTDLYGGWRVTVSFESSLGFSPKDAICGSTMVNYPHQAWLLATLSMGGPQIPTLVMTALTL